MNFIKLYIASLIVFLAIDFVWLGVIAKALYKEQIGHLMAPEIRWGAALLFYSIYLFGLVFFVISPAIRENSWNQALLYGALFGLICYATYDLTNYATLNKWPLKLVVYDLIWGSFASAIASLIVYWIGKTWLRSSS